MSEKELIERINNLENCVKRLANILIDKELGFNLSSWEMNRLQDMFDGSFYGGGRTI